MTMKHFGDMSIAEMMKVLLYAELDGETYPATDSVTRRQSLDKLLPMAKDKLREADKVVAEAEQKRESLVTATYKGAKESLPEWKAIHAEWLADRTMWHKLVVDAEKVVGVEHQGIPMSIINSPGAGQWISDWASSGAGPERIVILLKSHGMNPDNFITEAHVRRYLHKKIGLDEAEMDEMDARSKT